MPPPPYLSPGLNLSASGANDPAIMRALQEDLRSLGYLKSRIDGVYGTGVIRAVRALCFDLLNNDGRGKDGPAPVAVTAFNAKPGGGSYIAAVQENVDQTLAAVIAALASDGRIGRLPKSDQPAADNGTALSAIQAIRNPNAPTPFVVAIVTQESGGQHFRVPQTSGSDQDSYVVLGQDHDDSDQDQVTSRGYGIGQFTLFHHPPSSQDIADYIADPVRNVQNTFTLLRQKFDGFVVGKNGADDRAAEHPQLPLRLCKYGPADPRYLRDCRNCALAVRQVDIERGTPTFQGSSLNYQPTAIYPSASYSGTPDRAEFPCDWPYAARRYNGSGINSYHYQTHILRNLIR